jgi:phosphoserine phosphatase
MTTTEFTPNMVIQGFTPPLKLSNFKLIAFDMDSTLINIECIDEIADAAGRKAEVAAITEAAMRGEITDFKDSLRRRLGSVKRCKCGKFRGCLHAALTN